VIADALIALADPTRRRLFELVAERPGPVGELADQLPVSRPAVSQHLKVLRQAGLVQEERVGTRHVYRLDSAGLEILRTYFESFWDRSLAAFKGAAEQANRPRPPHPPHAEEAP
jgi:DNA-binding transcriptional ArsR family regulator